MNPNEFSKLVSAMASWRVFCRKKYKLNIFGYYKLLNRHIKILYEPEDLA